MMVVLAEAAFKQLGNGGQAVFHADIRNFPGDAGENEHSKQVRQGGENGLEAIGVGHAGPAHQSAAADDGGADGGHENQGTEGASGHVVVAGIFDAFDGVDAHQYHDDEVSADDEQVDDVQLTVIHRAVSSFAGEVLRVKRGQRRRDASCRTGRSGPRSMGEGHALRGTRVPRCPLGSPPFRNFCM